MKKRESGREKFKDVWEIIEPSVFILVAYNLIEFAFGINATIEKVMPAGIVSGAITIFAFGLIGYRVVKMKEKQPGKHGAYAGLIVGFIGAILGIITFYIFPERFTEAIQQAVQQGADPQTVQTFMKIGIYFSLVIAPAINAGIGALVAWISGMIFRKK